VRARAALGALLVLLGLAAAGAGCLRRAEGDVAARVADLERRLTTTCACHPRKIAGTPLEAAIRADIARWVEAGKPDDEVLWLAFARHGRALLSAGIADLRGEFHAAIGVTALVLLASAATLLAHLIRARKDPASGAPGATR
jgi:hypothetical protein